MSTKRCSKCGEEKAPEFFGRYSYARDGLQSYCKVCHYAINAAYDRKYPVQKLRRAREWARVTSAVRRVVRERCREL